MDISSVSEDALNAAVVMLRRCPSIDAAYLLGSGATGSLRPDSDVDVAVLPSLSAGISLVERRALTAELATIFGRAVDLGVLSTANVVYAKEAIATGRLICERNHRTTARFAMLVFSMYADLQQARREVLRAYAA
jgi:predicted nucleotidyltransferase